MDWSPDGTALFLCMCMCICICIFSDAQVLSQSSLSSIFPLMYSKGLTEHAFSLIDLSLAKDTEM